MLPVGVTHQFSNVQGDRPVRLLGYNYRPLAMLEIDDPEFCFHNHCSLTSAFGAGDEDLDSQAKQAPEGAAYWYSNFFPDMQAWDKMAVYRRGPDRVIIIRGGEGNSSTWQEGQEKTVVPWHEASLFVPRNRWFH